MSSIKRTYNLTITTLTPLHIGTGNDLLLDYDYVKRNGRTWVINEDALAEMLINEDPNDFDRMVQGLPARDLIRRDEYRADSPLFRYVLQGEPEATTSGARIQELIKDAWDRPYIPGSSLKGALRTALMYADFGKQRHTIREHQLGRKSSTAAIPLENITFRGQRSERKAYQIDPYYDLMRALQVSDSTSDVDQRLRLVNVAVIVDGKKPSIPIPIEAIAPKTTFYTTLSIDKYLLNELATQELGWTEEQSKLLGNIPRSINYWTLERLQAEEHRSRKKLWRNFFNWLANELVAILEDKHKNTHEFILQLGWGGGWDSKTLGNYLLQDKNLFRTLDKKYRIVPQGGYNAKYIFPRSKRVVMKDKMPRYSLGWVKVTMEELS